MIDMIRQLKNTESNIAEWPLWMKREARAISQEEYDLLMKDRQNAEQKCISGQQMCYLSNKTYQFGHLFCEAVNETIALSNGNDVR